MERIVIVGCSGHGKVVLDIARCQAKYQVAGFLDRASAAGTIVYGTEVLGREEDLPELQSRLGIDGAFVAIGDNWSRMQVAERLRRLVPRLPFATLVHPSAQLASGVEIGHGTAIMAGAVVNPQARIGHFCIVNTRASLDHDSVMADGSSLGPGVATGGNVTIGELSAIGIGATLQHRVTIGRHTVIGGAALVTRNIPDAVVAYGVPARVIRARSPSDSYL
jgi:sugar O-acyltransferase (sialic acid O-acetyltransferase NeuD family)